MENSLPDRTIGKNWPRLKMMLVLSSLSVCDIQRSMSKVSKKLSVEVDDIRKEFCHNMVKNIEDRFPKEAVDVAMVFHVLGMPP